jgi:hypothetical protein
VTLIIVSYEMLYLLILEIISEANIGHYAQKNWMTMLTKRQSFLGKKSNRKRRKNNYFRILE